MIIAHDLGTSGNKASLHDDAGHLLASATATYTTNVGADGRSEQDPDSWWGAVVAATHSLLAAHPGAAPDAICLSGQMMGAVLLDSSFRSTRPAMIWSDQRAVDEARQLRSNLGGQRAYELTGHRIAATYPLPKLMWVRDHEPEVWERTSHVCVAKDFVNYRLTGELRTDHTDASSTDAYALEAGEWSAECLTAATIDPRLFPRIVESTDVVGSLTRTAAAELGLRPGIPVVAGGGDGLMAALAVGCVASGDPGYVCLGTSAWYMAATKTVVLDPAQRSFVYRHAVPGLFAPCATTQCGGDSLSWLAGILGTTPVQTLALAAEGRGADSGLFFMPELTGSRSPWWQPQARGVFLGLNAGHRAEDLARAVLEGVGFNLALCIESVGASGGCIDVIGGGARSDLWLRILADIWGVTIRRRDVTTHANSLGAAVVGLTALGRAGWANARTLSTVTAEFSPGSDSARYGEHLARFVAGHEAVSGWFGREDQTP